MTALNSTNYKRQFNAEKYDRIEVTVPKGNKAVIKEFAEGRGKSVNGFINDAITEKMERDNG